MGSRIGPTELESGTPLERMERSVRIRAACTASCARATAGRVERIREEKE